jgi:hypothetical protein
VEEVPHPVPDPRDHPDPGHDPHGHHPGGPDRGSGRPPAPADPVTARRARIAARLRIATRIGYTALGGAIVAFIAAAATGFPAALVALSAAGLIAACVILPLPIILAYGVRAAEREERGWR